MTLWVGTSWKMTKTIAQARGFAAALVRAASAAEAAAPGGPWPGVQPFVIPPLTALAAVREALGQGESAVLGVQNAHWEDAGAWTGEISMPQVWDAGARLVEIGHS